MSSRENIQSILEKEVTDFNNNLQLGFLLKEIDEELLAKAITACLLSKASASKSAWVKWIYLASLEDLHGRTIPALSLQDIQALQENDYEYAAKNTSKSESRSIIETSICEKEKRDAAVQFAPRRSTVFTQTLADEPMESQPDVLIKVECGTQTDGISPTLRNYGTQTLLPTATKLSKESQATLCWHLYPIDGIEKSIRPPVYVKKEGDIDVFHGRPLITKKAPLEVNIPLEPVFSELYPVLTDPRICFKIENSAESNDETFF